MPTVCRITLDAEQYRRELNKVIAETRAAAALMNEAAPAASLQAKIEDQQYTVSGTVDAPEIPEVSDQAYTVSGTVEPPEIPEVSDQAYTVSGTVEPPEIPEAEDQSYTVSGTVDAPEIPEVPDPTYTVTGTVDAPEIPEAEDQSYTVSGTVDVPNDAGKVFDDIANGAADVSREVGKAGGKIGFFSRLMAKIKGINAGEQISKGATAVSAVGAAAGASVPPVGALAAVVNALLSPIALLTMAFTALLAIGKAVWDALTVSADEYAARAEHASAAAERQSAKLKEQAEAAQLCMERIKELNQAENASNTAKSETLSLLNSLQQEYGNLGAEVDRTSGKIKNLAEVEINLRRAQSVQEAQSLHKQADAKLMQARAAYMKGLGDSAAWSEVGAGRNWDEKLKKSPSAEAMLKEIKGVYKWAEKDGKSADVLKGITEAIGYLEEVAELRNQAESLQNTGFKNEDAARQAVVGARRAAGTAQSRWKDAASAAERRKQDDLFAGSEDYEYKKNNRLELLKSEQQKHQQAVQRKSSLQGQRLEITSQYSPGQEYSAEHAVAIARLDEQIAGANQESVAALSQAAELRKQIKELDRQQAEAEKKQAEAKNKLLEQSRYELQHSQLIADGEYGKAAALQLEYELREKNLQLTAAERAELEKAKNAQAELNLNSSLAKKALDLKYQAMEQSGQGQQAAQERALQEARETKGRDLTEEESAKVRSLADLTYKLNKQQGPQLGDLSIKTNALAARGGFAGSVKLPGTAQYNRAISENTKQLLATAQEIKNICRDLGNF